MSSFENIDIFRKVWNFPLNGLLHRFDRPWSLCTYPMFLHPRLPHTHTRGITTVNKIPRSDEVCPREGGDKQLTSAYVPNHIHSNMYMEIRTWNFPWPVFFLMHNVFTSTVHASSVWGFPFWVLQYCVSWVPRNLCQVEFPWMLKLRGGFLNFLTDHKFLSAMKNKIGQFSLMVNVIRKLHNCQCFGFEMIVKPWKS